MNQRRVNLTLAMPRCGYCGSFWVPPEGVNARNARDYLAQSNVMCVGGTWMVDAKAVRLPFSEVSKAMQSGTVQGTEGPWSNLRGQSAAGKPSYVTETNHGVLNYMLVANSEFWTSIPFALRSELENIVLEVTQTVNAEAAAINQREREQLIASGSATLVTLTPEQRQAWRTKMQPVWKSFESQIGADIMRAALTVNRR